MKDDPTYHDGGRAAGVQISPDGAGTYPSVEGTVGRESPETDGSQGAVLIQRALNPCGLLLRNGGAQETYARWNLGRSCGREAPASERWPMNWRMNDGPSNGL